MPYPSTALLDRPYTHIPHTTQLCQPSLRCSMSRIIFEMDSGGGGASRVVQFDCARLIPKVGYCALLANIIYIMIAVAY